MTCVICRGKGWVSTPNGKIRCPKTQHAAKLSPQRKPSAGYMERNPRNVSETQQEEKMMAMLQEMKKHMYLPENPHSGGTPKMAPSVCRETPLFESFAAHYLTSSVPASESKAQDIAAIMHAGQTCQVGEPYIKHPAAVARNVETVPGYELLTPQQQQHAKQAAWLHDTCEDTSLTIEDLQKAGFHPEVITAIVAVTKQKNEPNVDYYQRVLNAGRIAVVVKLADLAHNTNQERRMNLPGSPHNPVSNPKDDKYTRLGKKYYVAYVSLGVTPPPHLQQFGTQVN